MIGIRFLLAFVLAMTATMAAPPASDKSLCIWKFKSVIDKHFKLPDDIERFLKSLDVDWQQVFSVNEDDESNQRIFQAAASKFGRPDDGCELMRDFVAGVVHKQVGNCVARLKVAEEEELISHPKVRSFWQASIACFESRLDEQ